MQIIKTFECLFGAQLNQYSNPFRKHRQNIQGFTHRAATPSNQVHSATGLLLRRGVIGAKRD